MKILVLQGTNKGFYLRTKETATKVQLQDAEYLEMKLASQRDRGIADDAVGGSYESADEARHSANWLKPKVQVLTGRMLRAMAEDKREAES